MKRAVKVGKIVIGGGAPVSVQSMTNTPTSDTESTLRQILALEAAGCDIVRVAVSSMNEVEACKGIIGKTTAPLVADIQFDYKLAIACADIGFDKIRFNPGNIGGDGKYSKNIVCPDGCVMFRLTAKKTGNENFFKGKFFD